jgi:hypothetical protein
MKASDAPGQKLPGGSPILRPGSHAAPDPRDGPVAGEPSREAENRSYRGPAILVFIPPVQHDRLWCGSSSHRAFILARLEQAGLTNQPADADTDPPRDVRSIGLPPTPEEVEAVNDPPNAYEQLVKRLLSSPHYCAAAACWTWLAMPRTRPISRQ